MAKGEKRPNPGNDWETVSVLSTVSFRQLDNTTSNGEGKKAAFIPGCEASPLPSERKCWIRWRSRKRGGDIPGLRGLEGVVSPWLEGQ